VAVPLLNSFRKLCISVLRVLDELLEFELVLVLLSIGGGGGSIVVESTLLEEAVELMLLAY
jgi:hypothetical protein